MLNYSLHFPFILFFKNLFLFVFFIWSAWSQREAVSPGTLAGVWIGSWAARTWQALSQYGMMTSQVAPYPAVPQHRCFRTFWRFETEHGSLGSLLRDSDSDIEGLTNPLSLTNPKTYTVSSYFLPTIYINIRSGYINIWWHLTMELTTRKRYPFMENGIVKLKEIWELLIWRVLKSGEQWTDECSLRGSYSRWSWHLPDRYISCAAQWYLIGCGYKCRILDEVSHELAGTRGEISVGCKDKKNVQARPGLLYSPV